MTYLDSATPTMKSTSPMVGLLSLLVRGLGVTMSLKFPRPALTRRRLYSFYCTLTPQWRALLGTRWMWIVDSLNFKAQNRVDNVKQG